MGKAETGHGTKARNQGEAPERWTNWAGTYSVTPLQVAHPRTPDAVAELVRQATERDLSIKAIGSGHSFTDIGLTRGVLLHLDKLTGIITADRASGLVAVAAGTTLQSLNSALWDMGLALTNLGNISSQTISGAISTGTHGTGRAFGGIATQVRGLQLITGAGEVLNCSADEHPDVFAVARVGLGALGIITAVTLQCEPAFALHAVEAQGTLDALYQNLDTIVTGSDHFEFHWFPHTRRVLSKTNTRLPGDTELEPVGRLRGWLDDELLSNRVFEGVNRLTTLRPNLTPRANKIAARALPGREFTDRSYRVFASPRRVKFREMEYALPRHALPFVLDEIDAWVSRSGEQIPFPIEVRFAAPDDIPLSTAYGRETCYVAVRQYHRRPYDKYFLAVERIALEVGGRPHWGKLHFRTADQLAEQYPKFSDFLSVRNLVDPERRFGNDYLRRVLGT